MQSLPRVMQLSSVSPVPKPMAHLDSQNTDLYRGIGVGSIFKRVHERVIKNRLDSLAESLGIRAPTQCGFRRGHGCLDACFTLRHLVDKTRYAGGLLWVVFVDFKKAFDSVRRDLLIERCRQIGVHGPFLDAICMLYDRVVFNVKVNGTFGTEFDTYLGTIQGSELSPLLFGLFMDLLHQLIAVEIPGAGSLVGSLRCLR